MSAFTPTPEQAGAIEHAFADACVVAGAGSGKTAVLTRRFIHLVREHGLDVRRVAALTFTEKAAGEMRERIARALEESGLDAAREDVEFAPISTIHAYCARLLRTHAVEAGVDPAFVMLDEVESALLREDAFHLARQELAAEGDGAAGVLARIGADAPDLLGLLERVRGAGLDPQTLIWCDGRIDVALERKGVEEQLAAMRTAGADLDEVAPRLAAAGAELERLLEDDSPSPWAWSAARSLVVASTPAGRRRGPKAFSSARKVLLEHLDQLASAALDALGAREIMPELRTLLGRAGEVYQRLKDERSALDFTDLELGALHLLEGLAAGGRVPASGPQAILVDEYQDTNPLQARLLKGLRGGRVPMFSVGDPKQSIYRFRRADVRVIQKEWEDVGTGGRHRLEATFRARPPLVDVLNSLHERLFEGGAAGAKHAPLDARGAFRAGEGPDVELSIVDVGSTGNVALGREGEARLIAQRIRAFVDGGALRARVDHDAEGVVLPARPFTFGDFAILLRARTDLQSYEDALAAEGIPYQTHKGRGYFQAEEVVDLLHALRVVHDPADDFALACLLTSPIVGATDADLLGIFEGGRAEPGRAWARFVERAASEHGGRFEVVHLAIERLRIEALAGHLAKVVEGVLSDLGLLEAALLQDEGARRAANLRKAVEVARDLEQGGRQDLADLLRHLSTLRDREVAEAEAVFGAEGGNAVQINTVHGAKGLEYPVVFLADVGRQPAVVRDALLFDPDLGIAVRLRHPLEGTAHKPGGYDVLKDEEDARQAEENLRLLYVGQTRAEERLILTGTCCGLTRKDAQPKRFSGWGKALLDALGAVPAPDPQTFDFGRGSLCAVRVDPPEEGAPPSAPTSLGAATDAGVREAERVAEAAAATVAPLGGTPFVVTVTDLLRFARSPAELYGARLESRLGWGGGEARVEAEADDPQAGLEHTDPDAERRRTRTLLFDEDRAGLPPGRVDRAALGRAVHALIEGLPAGADAPEADETARVLAGEFPLGVDEATVGLAARMVHRFARSDIGRRVAAAEAAGRVPRREIAFHVRIRFPGGVPVGPFESLLVRGSIDLWLPGEDGVVVVDHKTNPPGGRLRTPEDVGRHYAWQLRLYALAAERLLGTDVAGARLVLLDPGWGPEAIEVSVDVTGDALEETRQLCRAYAVAELEARWPRDWRTLLEEHDHGRSPWDAS